MLASSVSSKMTGSAQQMLTKNSKCVGDDHCLPVFLIAPNLNSEKKYITACFNCSILKGSISVLVPEHNLIPNKSELLQIAARFTYLVMYLLDLLAQSSFKAC